VCGRFASTLSAELMRRLFATEDDAPNLPPSWNIAPSQDALVVRRHPATGVRRLDALRWGLVPHFTKQQKGAPKPINARAESVATAGLFRGAFAARRCIIPADCFYEWQTLVGGKQPYAIARRDGAPLALGGIWEGWRSADGEVIRSFAIITTAASAEMRALHERMPLLLEPADWPLWLGETTGDAATLLQPAAEGRLRLWPVSSRVNSPKNNDPDLLAPIAAAPILEAPILEAPILEAPGSGPNPA
jgi:putative SOS response-associated peptidase YedK